MLGRPTRDRAFLDGARHRAGDAGGHYESWFCRANHPTRPLAFWIRYAVTVPKGRPFDAHGERWATWFDGEAGTVASARETMPVARCSFDPRRLDVRVGDARIDDAGLDGSAGKGDEAITWSLRRTGGSAPLLLLPDALYAAPLPRAKVIVGAPLAQLDGTVRVGGAKHDVEGWIGSHDHHWGSRHSDRYVWTQVAGFDGRPDAFFEASTAWLGVGPLRAPPLTVVVLRLGDEAFALHDPIAAYRAEAALDGERYVLRSVGRAASIEATIVGAPAHAAALEQVDPAGGTQRLQHLELARAEVTLRRPGQPTLHLSTERRAVLELLGA